MILWLYTRGRCLPPRRLGAGNGIAALRDVHNAAFRWTRKKTANLRRGKERLTRSRLVPNVTIGGKMA